MKKINITIIVAAALAMLGAAPLAEARSYGHPASHVYISGHRSCGTPIYKERFFIRYNHCRRPVWGYRVVAGPRHYYRPAVRPPVYRAKYGCVRR